MRVLKGFLLVFACLALLPSAAFAQATASITGVVKDTSGAVLPGVTVEASSDVLIEKVRSAVTDGGGQYRIVDLRAGVYTVTFSLTGFSTVKREGVELSGSFTASINAEMKVGALTETITVTAESPIVDVQSVRRQTTITNDTISAMPAARSYAGVMMLIPATTTQAANLDLQVTPGMLVFGGAGGRNNEARIQVDGLNTGAAFNGAGVSSYVPDIGNAQEIVMTTSGGLGEAEVGGPSFSIVPKAGGNSLKGSVYASNVAKWMVGSNYTDDLKARGLTTPGELFKLWDYNVGLGGPIKKDRVWFFFQARDEGSHRTVPGMFANVNMGDPTKWTYVADTSRPAVHAGSWRNGALRLTVQPNTRNKINLFWDQQQPCQGAGYPGVDNDGCRQSGPNEIICGAFGASNPACNATNAPETGTYLDGYGQRVQQATWTSPVSNKLLLEAGFGTYWSQWGGTPWPGSPFNNLILVNEQCTAGCQNNGGIAGLNYRSTILGRHNLQGTTGWRASAAYVTGAQSMKFGYQGGYLIDNQFTYNNPQFVTFRVNNGIPNRITETINQIPLKQRVRYDAFYAQDQWTRGRFTLQGALRFDRAWSFFPEVTIPATRFLPNEVNYQRTDGVTGYNDITPRGGLAVDIFGNGKTSLKVNVGKYLQAAQNGLTYGALRPSGRLQTTANRTWTDANGNFAPDCDLLNRGAQSPATTGSIDTCAAIDNVNFGTEIFTSDLDPALRSGWGVRPSDWQWGASVQQQILPRVSIEVGYNRRWLTAFNVVDNVLQASSDYDPFSITVPNDGLLPAGVGGKTVTGLYNANPRVSAQQNNITKLATDFGGQSQTADGVLLNIAARPRFGLVFQGGVSGGVTHFDECDIRAALPETIPRNVAGTLNVLDNFCSNSVKGIRYSGLASYTIPKVDVLVSGTFRSDQGTVLAANYTVTSAVVAQTLGRPLSNAAPNVTINLVEPGTLYGDRITEFDMRFAKILRFGRTRTNVGFDVYNILNAAPVILYNQAYIPVGSASNPNGSWLVPNQVLTPRFAKFSIQFDF